MHTLCPRHSSLTLLALQVLERAKQYRPMGAGIGIDVNGMKAIDAIDPALRRWFNEEGHSLSSSVINDDKGEPCPPCVKLRNATLATAVSPCSSGCMVWIICLWTGSSLYSSAFLGLMHHFWAARSASCAFFAGNFIREDKNDTEKAKRRYGISPTLMGWYEIQQAFYRLLPGGMVTFDSR